MRARALAAVGDWGALEDVLSPPPELRTGTAVDAVMATSLDAYTVQLADLLRQGSEQAAMDPDVQGLYWEFDPDNDWDSTLFLCSSYLPDLDWYGLEKAAITGPECPLSQHEHVQFFDPAGELGVARVMACFGRAFDLAGPVELPVAFSWHDGIPLYAPLPAGAMTLEQVDRTPSLTPEPGRWYALSVSPADEWVHPKARVEDGPDGDARGFPVQLHGWRREPRLITTPTPVHRLIRGRFEQLLHVDAAPLPVVSDAVVRILQQYTRPDDVIDTIPVQVLSADAATSRDYHYVAIRSGPVPVDLTLEQRQTILGGAGGLIFDTDAVADRHVFWPNAPYFISPKLIALLSFDATSALLRETDGTGMSIRPVHVLLPDTAR